MGMTICPFHGEQMMGFISAKVGDLIRDNAEIKQELIRLTITDKDIELSSSQLMLKEEVESFMEKLGKNLFIHVDDLDQLSIPYCGKCIKMFLEKKAFMPSDEELFLTLIE